MAISVDIGTKSEGYATTAKDVYTRKPVEYQTYYFDVTTGGTVKSAGDLRKELKKAEKAEKAERKEKARKRELDDRYATAIKNLRRLAKGDGRAAVEACERLIAESEYSTVL